MTENSLIPYYYEHGMEEEYFNSYKFNVLNSSLEKNQRYYGHFYVVIDDGLAINKLGMQFFKDKDSVDFRTMKLKEAKKAHPPVYSQQIIPPAKQSFDAHKWYKIDGTFIADSAYNSLGIGVFHHNLTVDTIHVPPHDKFYEPGDYNTAGYSIDDVGVYEVPRIMSTRDTTVCKGDSVPIVLKGGQPYYISKKSHPTDTLSTDSITWVQPNQTTTYYINSVIKDSVKVRIYNPEENQLDDYQGYCPEQTLQLNSDYVPGVRYEWNTGDTTPVLEVSEPGTYVLHSQAGSCKNWDTANVFEKEKPAPLEVSGERALCKRQDEQVTLEVQNGNYESFQWHPSGQPGPQIMLSDTGHYQVTGEYWNGCKQEKAITIASSCPTTFYVPNAFSPNGDGNNDEFCPKGLDVTNYRLRIYNRYGTKIFETTTFNECWDGTYKGEPVPIGTYIYTIEYTHKADEATQYNKFKDGTVRVIK